MAGRVAVDAAHEAQAIAADAADAGLMMVGRADPEPRDGDDGVGVIREHGVPRKKAPDKDLSGANIEIEQSKRASLRGAFYIPRIDDIT